MKTRPGSNTRRRSKSRRRWWALAAIAAVTSACGGELEMEAQTDAEAELTPRAAVEQRQAAVAEAGAAVMPFDLDRSTHYFEPLDDGGLQTVVSDDGDAEQVALIRSHLATEAERFSRGEFHDPAMIHGEDMAGLHALVTGHERLEVTYRDVEDGGEIRYASEDTALVDAIHEWFEAQVEDHGPHAQAHRP